MPPWCAVAARSGQRPLPENGAEWSSAFLWIMLMFVQPSMVISYTFYTKHEIAGSPLSCELVEPDVLPFLLTGCVCPGLGLYEQFSTCSFLCFLPLLCTPTHPLFISLFSPCLKVVFYQNNFNLILQNFGWQLSASAVKCAQFQLKY